MQDDTPTNQPIEGATGTPADPAPLLPPELRGKLSMGLIALGSVMLMVVIFRMLWRQRRARSAPVEETPRRRPGTPPPRSVQAHDRLEQLMADSEELTRRLAAILDNKAAKLEVLIEQADERTRRLEQMAAEPPPARPAARSATARQPDDDNRPSTGESTDPLHRKVYELADQGLTPVDIARKTDRPTGQVELILALRRV